MFSFLHAADLHLDTPFKGVGSRRADIAASLRDASLVALDHLVDAAIGRSVDFVVLSGDLYDGAKRGLRAQIRFHRAVTRLSDAGIRTFVVHGNHDPVDEGWTARQDWPALYHRFGTDEVGEVRFTARDGSPVVVHGISYGRRDVSDNLALRFPKAGQGAFHVAVLHANVGAIPEHKAYSPCTVSDLCRTGHHYWALGHVHTRQTLSATPHIVYPGNLQGRHAREQGARGAVLVRVDRREVVGTEFLPLDVVRFERVEVDLGELETIDRVAEAIESEVRELRSHSEGRGLIVTVAMSGSGPVAETLTAPGHLTQLQKAVDDQLAHMRPFAWCADWQVDLHEAVDLDTLAQGDDLIATIIGDFEALLGSSAAVQAVLDEVLEKELPGLASEISDLPDLAREALVHAVTRMQA